MASLIGTLLSTGAVARADETRAIVDVVTAYDAAHIFSRITWTDASVVRAGKYALFSALDEEADAGALLERNNGHWEVAVPAKGSFDVTLLVSLGIPPNMADRLVIPCPPHTLFVSAMPTPRAIRSDGLGYAVTTASRRLLHVNIRTVRIPAQIVRFSHGTTSISQRVPATNVSVCEP